MDACKDFAVQSIIDIKRMWRVLECKKNQYHNFFSSYPACLYKLGCTQSVNWPPTSGSETEKNT